MILAVKAVMHVRRGIEIGMTLVRAVGTKEELAPFAWDALICYQSEPQHFRTTARTILRRTMRVNLDGYHSCCIGFFFRELIDFAFELIGVFAI